MVNNFKGRKEGHVNWKQFDDEVEAAFTTKNLEKAVDAAVGVARTQTFYGTKGVKKNTKGAIAHALVSRFRAFIRRERLDCKSFFQSWDRHNHYKVSPKQFRQVLSTFNFIITDEEFEAAKEAYSNANGEIEYIKFLDAVVPNDDHVNKGSNTTYRAQFNKFDGESEIGALLYKIKVMVKKNRIRLLEFFQDHDNLRKGYVPFMKFKGTLHAQKVTLTDQEYEILMNEYQTPFDDNLINYKAFDDDIEKIFVEKELEKAPTKTFTEFKAPSILDPKDVLNDAEERELEHVLR